MLLSPSRKKSTERTEQSGSGNVGMNAEEEDQAVHTDEESDDEGKKKSQISTFYHGEFLLCQICCLLACGGTNKGLSHLILS